MVHNFFDVIVRESNALKPLDERFKVGTLYESHTLTDKLSAEAYGRMLRKRYPNADIKLKHWTCTDHNEFNTISVVTI